MQETGQSADDAFGRLSDENHEGSIGEVRLADGELFDIPGVQGRLERLDFGNGMILHRAELRVRENSLFDVRNSLPPGWLGGSAVVMGKIEIECPHGRRYQMTPDVGLIKRVDPFGTRYFLPKDQMLRHVGVAIPLEPLKQRFADELPESLEPFLSDRQDIVDIRPLAVNSRIRSIVSAMFSGHVSGVGRHLKLDGLASLFLAEIIDLHAQQAKEISSSSELTQLEKAVVGTVIAMVSENPAAPISIEQLAADNHMTRSRLNSLFRQETGKSCSEFIRSQRMMHARELLASGGVTVKQVAAAVGFNHVSNFSRSYRDWYGESPAQAQKGTGT
ncbi:helix-turn-helix transcriptional regulator [Thalassospira sp. HF15]|uniref:helix-turn-helix transcriptional regulator n=1 Tax=Thalassospira sp. HF15 TaxID=2722755 RepID=UPI00143072E8|nr:helix-turn-helix transcriptional regulator [Thalassospira sp. HF15]NIY76841.1 helix-turn-helix transcriptional regulator [Thalassospira sp. HF15]